MAFVRKAGTHVAILVLSNRSLTLPPATLRNAALQNPVKNRKIKYTAMSGGNATAHEKAKKTVYEEMYTGLRPYTSERGPTRSGPIPAYSS